LVVTQVGRFGGWALCLFDGKPTFQYNTVGVFNYTVMAKDKLAPGRHALLVSFDYDGGGVGKGGKVTLSVDDKPIAEGRIERTIPFRISLDETLDIGEDTGTPVSKDYTVPFHFTGKLNRVLVRIGETKLTAEDEEQIRRAKAAIGLAR
jgi:arylsulfatase